jgi:hypothetical protein
MTLAVAELAGNRATPRPQLIQSEPRKYVDSMDACQKGRKSKSYVRDTISEETEGGKENSAHTSSNRQLRVPQSNPHHLQAKR